MFSQVRSTYSLGQTSPQLCGAPPATSPPPRTELDALRKWADPIREGPRRAEPNEHVSFLVRSQRAVSREAGKVPPRGEIRSRNVCVPLASVTIRVGYWTFRSEWWSVSPEEEACSPQGRLPRDGGKLQKILRGG